MSIIGKQELTEEDEVKMEAVRTGFTAVRTDFAEKCCFYGKNVMCMIKFYMCLPGAVRHI